jgi:LPPG:FO 2-phospho-L-lactate transferase
LVAVLAGGTGGAKLARGLADVTDVRVIANTADDVEVHGVHVSPDPDLVTYWLADLIDERGWGVRGDTWNVMDALERAGAATWFRLGDQDLAMCLVRTERLRAGDRLTEAHAALLEGLGVTTPVLPMADEPVRTRIASGGRLIPFQEFMIVERAEPPIEGVELDGIERARPTPEVLDALAKAETIVIGPSNPVISIGPILAVPGMREAIASSPAPVVAVSPFVGGHAVKGPTDAFCEHAGIALGAAGIARAYSGLLDGLVADEPAPEAGIAVHVTDTMMDTPEARRRVATTTLEFAASLSRD